MNIRHLVNAFLLTALLATAGCGGNDPPGGTTPPGTSPPIADRTPDAFSFAPVVDANPGEYHEVTTTISGLDDGEAVPASLANLVVEGFALLVNGVEQDIHQDRTVRNGDIITVRLQARSAPESVASGEFFAGEPSVSAVFEVTTKADEESPELAVHFPPAFGITDAASIRVRGTVQDQALATLTVGGTTVSPDPATGNWHFDMPLSAGPNRIEVRAEDTSKNISLCELVIDTTSATVGSGEPMSSGIQALEVSPDGSSVFYGVTDGTIYKLDLETGQRTVLSREPDAGDGPALNTIRGMAIGGDGELLVANHTQLSAVSMATGNRISLSNNTGTGSGPIFNAFGVTRNPSSGTIYVASAEANRKIYSVTLPSGDRSIISDVATGTGPIFDDLNSITIDETTGDLFTNGEDVLGTVVFKVDPATGNRTIVSAGDGPALGSVSEVRYWQEEDVVLVSDGSNDALVKVDPTNGDRSIVSGSTLGQGPRMGNPEFFALHALSSVAFVTATDSNDKQAIYAIDLNTGDRVIIAAD